MNKFHAVPTTVNGIRFASQKEATRYQELREREQAGAIIGLVAHPSWDLVVNGVRIGKYTADAAYTDRATCAPVVEDTKGVRTRDYILRKKLMLALYEIEIVEV